MGTPILDRLRTEEPPGPIYHYTSGSALKKILESLTIWASAIQYLNDAMEFNLALDLVRNYIRNFEDAAEKGRKPILRWLREQMSRIELFNAFVFSLSEDGNLLSQWRGYCPPDGGYSLGFPGADLRQVVTAQGYVLARCVYDDQEQARLIAEAVHPTLQGLPDLADEAEVLRVEGEPYARRLFAAVAPVAPLVKHRKFSEEREWRVICTHPSTYGKILQRVGRRMRMLIPYVPINLSFGGMPVPLVEIFIGPTPHQRLASNSLAGILNRKELKWSIRFSDIPYR